MNFMIDTLLGTAMNVSLLFLIIMIARKNGSNKLDSGYYGNPPSAWIWLLQLSVWLSVIIVVKCILFFGVIFPFKSLWNTIGSWLLGPVTSNPKTELVLVMIVFPVILNVFQFWIQDNFLKRDLSYKQEDDPDYEHGGATSSSGYEPIAKPSDQDKLIQHA
eukprot:TRINITY_DN6286_c0_g1_i4.p1 TRINITY_DN6286_c0_g1~~TRINITY_DN6286_c0_g1_i4.p1  ORF type:complete len:161 (-),score=44.45 TRINITY_DN6286_c0_g1_i4:166-648(-)